MDKIMTVMGSERLITKLSQDAAGVLVLAAQALKTDDDNVLVVPNGPRYARFEKDGEVTNLIIIYFEASRRRTADVLVDTAVELMLERRHGYHEDGLRYLLHLVAGVSYFSWRLQVGSDPKAAERMLANLNIDIHHTGADLVLGIPKAARTRRAG